MNHKIHIGDQRSFALSPVILCRLLRFGAIMCIFVVNSASAAPKVECDNPKYDFGTRVELDKVVHDFILWNRSDEPLEILKIKDCCGMKSTVDSMIIPPGSNVTCRAVFSTKNRYGTQHKQIIISTSDRKNPYLSLIVTGTLLKPFEITPRYIQLGSLRPDSTVLETITVANLLDNDVSLDSVSSSVPGLEARIVESGEQSWTIQLRSVSPLDPDKITGNVQLGFSVGAVNVPVFGTVTPIIPTDP